MKTQLSLAGSAWLAMAFLGHALAAGEITVMPDEIVDVRSNEKKPAEAKLTVRLKVSNLNSVEAVRVTPLSAVDGAGKQLVDAKFKVEWKETYEKFEVELKSPARGAQTLRELSGTIELYNPKADPDSVVSFDDASQLSPQTLKNPILKAAGIQVNVLNQEQVESYKELLRNPEAADPYNLKQTFPKGMSHEFDDLLKSRARVKPNTLVVRLQDPNKLLANLEFKNQVGRGINYSSIVNPDIRVYDFFKPVPSAIRLVLYVATPKAVKTMPFKFTDVALP